jgi:hypothetical protein
VGSEAAEEGGCGNGKLGIVKRGAVCHVALAVVWATARTQSEERQKFVQYVGRLYLRPAV